MICGGRGLCGVANGKGETQSEEDHQSVHEMRTQRSPCRLAKSDTGFAGIFASFGPF